MNRFAWMPATTVSEAATGTIPVADAMTEATGSRFPDGIAIVKAGGIDLLDLMKEDLLRPDRVLNLRTVAGLDIIREDLNGNMHLGALVTLSSIVDHPLVRLRYPALVDAIETLASPQIRNIATVGGNLLQRPRCWYFRSKEFHCLRKGGNHCFAHAGENQYHAVFDNHPCAIVHPSTAATPLVALGATVTLTDAEGHARSRRLEDFLAPQSRELWRENDLNTGEIVTAIHIPMPTANARMAYLKQAEKDSVDWPLAEVAVVLDLGHRDLCNRAIIVMGAAAPTPFRPKSAEALLTGKVITEEVARESARAALNGATPLSKNAYKVPLFETLIRRALMKAMAAPPV